VSDTQPIVLAVAPEMVRPLRKEVLRPGTPIEALTYEHDSVPGVLHAAVLEGKAAVATGTVMPDPHPLAPAPGDWRVRGMATRADMRNRGLGAAVLAFCEAHARANGARRLWCNARVGAVAFYERAGMAIEGELFEIEAIGPHYLMSKPLE